MSPFMGVGVAIVTPFDENNKIDELSLRRLVDYIIDGGVNFITALGTTAETPTLSMSERAMVIDIVHDQISGRVPLMIGLGGYSTQEVVEQLASFPSLHKADALLSVAPYYNKPSQEGIYAHFAAIAGATEKPIFLYNVPGRTGVNISAATVKRLASSFSNIIGLKEATGGNFAQATQLMELRNDFILLSGDDSLALPLMSMGFHGVISVMANCEPRTMVDIVNNAMQNNWNEARAAHYNSAPLCDALFAEGNPVGVKAALHINGIIEHNTLRLPLVPATVELYERIRELL
ncbi:MAG: 4-hydroxy-tetrahydrodipicolinate synthase [Marinifilaceae bacterium]